MAQETLTGSHIVETQKLYELMLVFKPDILESALEKKLKEFEQFLADNDGKVEVKDIWGKRDLAYGIKQYNQGNYVVYNLVLPNTFIQELDESLRINTDVMRHLIVKMDEGYKYEKPSAPETSTPVKTQKAAASTSEGNKGKPDKKPENKSLDEKLESILSNEELSI